MEELRKRKDLALLLHELLGRETRQSGFRKPLQPLFLGLEEIQLDQTDPAVCSVMEAQHSFVVYL